MQDKFGYRLSVGDFVVYNECVVGRVINGDIAIVPTMPFDYSLVGYMPIPKAPRVKYGVRVVNERGRETIVTDKNKIIRMGGLPPDIVAKFK